MQDWQAIWARRTVTAADGGSVLAALIQADGFDSGAGDYTEDQWLAMARDLTERLELTAADRILEVGCGAGALLYALRMHTGCGVAGVDYSETLIDAARQAMPGGAFEVAPAKALPFHNGSFDAVVAHSVFHYFPDIGYSRQVIEQMMRVLKPGGRISVMDVNDVRLRDDYERLRRAWFKSPEEYDRKYSHLDHLFLGREQVKTWLEDSGAVLVRNFPHKVPQYLNSRFRFNVIGAKQR